MRRFLYLLGPVPLSTSVFKFPPGLTCGLHGYSSGNLGLELNQSNGNKVPHWAHLVLAPQVAQMDFHLEETQSATGAEKESMEPVLLHPSSWVSWSMQKLCEQDCQVKGHH